MKSPNKNYMSMSENDEISLSDLIKAIVHEIKAFLRLAIWWVPLSLVVAGLVFYITYAKPVEYESSLTFMVNDDDGSGGAGVGAILGQFGLGGGALNEVNYERILELAKSRKIVVSMLNDTVSLNERRRLIELVYDRLEISKQQEIFDWASVDFTELESLEGQLDRHSSEAVNRIYSKIVGNALLGEKGITKITANENTGILNIKTHSIDEEASLHITNMLYEKLSTYYIKSMIEKNFLTYSIISQKTDSLEKALSSAEANYASIKDKTGAQMLRKDRLVETRASRKITLLQLMYGEAVKNKATSEFLLQTKTPYFQTIDTPLYPLVKLDPSPLKGAILGFIAISALSFILFASIRAFQNLLNTETHED